MKASMAFAHARSGELMSQHERKGLVRRARLRVKRRSYALLPTIVSDGFLHPEPGYQCEPSEFKLKLTKEIAQRLSWTNGKDLSEVTLAVEASLDPILAQLQARKADLEDRS